MWWIFLIISKFLSYYCLHFRKNIAHHIPEMLIFHADKVFVMGCS